MVVKMVNLGYVLDGNHNRPSLYREHVARRWRLAQLRASAHPAPQWKRKSNQAHLIQSEEDDGFKSFSFGKSYFLEPCGGRIADAYQVTPLRCREPQAVYGIHRYKA